MDLPTIATVGQLLNAAVSTAKNVRDIAKDSSDSTLKNEISSLYDALLDIKARVLDLDEENRSLKAQLVAKNDIEGPIKPHGYFRYKSRPNNPLCPKCLQSKDQRPVFLSEPEDWNGGKRRDCVVCGFFHMETPMQHAEVRLGISRRPYTSRR